MTTRRILYKLHLWLSLPLGILIVLICLSGATLVFKNEIRNALGMPKVVAPTAWARNMVARLLHLVGLMIKVMATGRNKGLLGKVLMLRMELLRREISSRMLRSFILD